MQTLTPPRRATSPRSSNVEQSWVPAPTEFSTTGSATAPAAPPSPAARSLARPRPSTSRSMPSASPSPPWLPACTTTRSTPRVPAAASSRARATMERSRCSSFVEARFMRYFACATTGEMPNARLPSTKSAASLRGLGSAQACGLETKIWIVSHPSSRAASRVLTSPPEVGRCRPTLFLLPGMARILAVRRGSRCERYNLSKQSEGAPSMAIEGKVAKVLGNNEIVINRGRGQGVRQGMLFEIFAPEGEEVWDPDTGETLGTVEDVKAKAEITEVKEKLSVARIFDAASPFGTAGAAGFGEMQENLQRMFQQMFGENVQVQGFGTGRGPDDGPDLESLFGGPLEDVTKVQVGDAIREIKRR